MTAMWEQKPKFGLFFNKAPVSVTQVSRSSFHIEILPRVDLTSTPMSHVCYYRDLKVFLPESAEADHQHQPSAEGQKK